MESTVAAEGPRRNHTGQTCPETRKGEGESMAKNPMNNLSYGLFVLTAAEGEKHNGCIINTVTQVTTEPNQITIAVNTANYTNEMIRRTGKFTVSVLSEEADFDLFKHFGFQSGRNVDKFADFTDARPVENGTMCITRGTNAYISAKVVQEIDLSTHTLFLAEVTASEVLADVPSATYAYYHAHIKPAPAPKKPEGKAVWVCQICGYVYEGDPIPADFICPLCKHPASDFERQVQPAKEEKAVWVCNICGYVYEGDPIPADFICPLCKHPASDFSRKVE